MTHSVTRATVRATARVLGMSVRYVDREYRVNYRNGDEATAYYTTDAQDAINTMFAMSDERGN